jgi:hypothetical protein
MSTATEGGILFSAPTERRGEGEDRFGFLSTVRSLDATTAGDLKFGPVTKKRKNQEPKQHIKVLRRLSGLLIELQGKTALVDLEADGNHYRYEIPSDNLIKCGVKIKNQPFQMDEVEIQMEDGVVTGYKFKALASADDVFSDLIELDAERKKKQELIFSYFAKSKT